MPVARRKDHPMHPSNGKRYVEGECPRRVFARVGTDLGFNTSEVECPYALTTRDGGNRPNCYGPCSPEGEKCSLPGDWTRDFAQMNFHGKIRGNRLWQNLLDNAGTMETSIYEVTRNNETFEINGERMVEGLRYFGFLGKVISITGPVKGD